ncbi:MAG: inositol-3-phosphate synthase [Planctomycetota bacterium]
MPSPETNPAPSPNTARLGVWLVGARGAISTCAFYGLEGLSQGLIEPIGLATTKAPLDDLPFASFDSIVLGGHEISARGLSASAAELVRHRVLRAELIAATSAEAAAYDARVRPGILDGPDVGLADLLPESARRGALAPREQLAVLGEDLDEFRRREEVDRLVVVYLASTEAWREPAPFWNDLAAFDEALDAGQAVPASSLYAYAAFQAGAAFVNFTPNVGASLPAVAEFAYERGLPHCGNDGKTGETLLKTTLAPMFAARALRVHAWQGYNMLGNRDGEVLSDPARAVQKKKNKDEVLRELLGTEVHSHVGIDYVPSLHDWKTAMDYVHFEGFLGAMMSLQFTWTGSDSALAAPLVLDLVRLADLALARGEAGSMKQTACFFKSPLSGGTHDFLAQVRELHRYAERVRRQH